MRENEVVSVGQAIVFRGLPAWRERRRQKTIVCATEKLSS